MRKTIILTIAVLVGMVGFQSSAMAGGAGGFGIKGGLAISTIGTGDEDFSSAKNRFRLGGTGGFSYELATEGTFAFEVDLLYDLRGQKQEFDNFLGEGTVKDYLHYLNLPLSMKFYIGDVFNLHFGGYVGAAIAGTRNIDGEDLLGNTIETKTDLFSADQQDAQGDDYLNRIDGGIHFGAEFVSTSGFGVGSRAYIGLADITNDAHQFGNGAARTAEVSVYAIIRIGSNK